MEGSTCCIEKLLEINFFYQADPWSKFLELSSLQNTCRVLILKKLDSTLCFGDFLQYSEAVFGVKSSSRVGAFTIG